MHNSTCNRITAYKNIKTMRILSFIVPIIITAVLAVISAKLGSTVVLNFYTTILFVGGICLMSDYSKAYRLVYDPESIHHPVPVWASDTIKVALAIILCWKGFIYAPIMILLWTATYAKAYLPRQK